MQTTPNTELWKLWFHNQRMCCPSRLVHKLLKWNINHLSSWVSTLLLGWRHCCFEEHDGIMGKLQSLWVPVTRRSWKAEFCKLRMHCSLSSEVWVTLESCSYLFKRETPFHHPSSSSLPPRINKEWSKRIQPWPSTLLAPLEETCRQTQCRCSVLPYL